MDDGFDRAFYPSSWRRVLPLSPDGIQPYARTGRSPGLPAAAAGLHHLAIMVQRAVRSGRPAALNLAPWRGGVAGGTQCCP